MQKILLFILLILSIASCKVDSGAGFSSETIRLIDSTKVTSTKFPFWISFSSSNQLLAYDPLSHDISLMNNRGDTLHYFNKFGEGAEAYQRVRGIDQLPDGRLLLYSTFDYYLYQPDGTFVKSGKIGPEGTMANPNPSMKAPIYTDSDGTSYLVYPGGYPPAHPANTPEGISEFPLASTVNIQNEDFHTAAKLPEGSIFHQSFFSNNFPLLDIYADQLFVKMPYGNEVYLFQLPGLEYLGSLEISGETDPQGVKYGQNKAEMIHQAFLNYQKANIYTQLVATGPTTCWLERLGSLPETISPATNMREYLDRGLAPKRPHSFIYVSPQETRTFITPNHLSLSLIDVHPKKGLVLNGPLNEENNEVSIYFAAHP
jgi:hypothetical protein